jgi:G3E family GTPase
MTAPLPVTLIAGYLGAGKTTVVNHLLRNAGGRRLAVLVNEFGALPIDEDLIEAQDDDLISIAGGCICCSFGSDLTGALIELAQLDPRPDHVLIEASGVAIPGAIAGAMSMLDSYAPCGVCVLADVTSLRRLMVDEYVGDTVERQLNDAGLVVLTKTDLAVHLAGETAAWLTEKFPDTPILQICDGQLAPELLLGTPHNAASAWQGTHADQDYDSFVHAPTAPIHVQELAQALRQGGHGIIRAKGFLVDETGKQALVQMVGKAVDVTHPESDAKAGLVFIGLKGQLDQEAITALFADHNAKANAQI